MTSPTCPAVEFEHACARTGGDIHGLWALYLLLPARRLTFRRHACACNGGQAKMTVYYPTDPGLFPGGVCPVTAWGAAVRKVAGWRRSSNLFYSLVQTKENNLENLPTYQSLYLPTYIYVWFCAQPCPLALPLFPLAPLAPILGCLPAACPLTPLPACLPAPCCLVLYLISPFLCLALLPFLPFMPKLPHLLYLPTRTLAGPLGHMGQEQDWDWTDRETGTGQDGFISMCSLSCLLLFLTGTGSPNTSHLLFLPATTASLLTFPASFCCSAFALPLCLSFYAWVLQFSFFYPQPSLLPWAKVVGHDTYHPR